MDAWKQFQGAYDAFHNAMKGYAPQPSEKMMAGKEDVPEEMDMPEQKDGAEPGSYDGKGMMAGKDEDMKMSMVMESLKKKGY